MNNTMIKTTIIERTLDLGNNHRVVVRNIKKERIQKLTISQMIKFNGMIAILTILKAIVLALFAVRVIVNVIKKTLDKIINLLCDLGIKMEEYQESIIKNKKQK